jgi:hypothetical protein
MGEAYGCVDVLFPEVLVRVLILGDERLRNVRNGV